MNNVRLAPPILARLPGEARRIIAEIVPNGIRSTEEIRHGLMTFKCLVQTDIGDRFVVRFYPPSRGPVVDVEPDLLQRCQRAGIPVPIVVADSRRGPKATLSYVAYRWIDGKMLSERLPTLSDEQQKVLARDLARTIFELQQIEFHGFGELSTAETAHDASWLEFVSSSCRSGLHALRRYELLDGERILELEAALARTTRLVGGNKPQLVWGDISFDNILVDPSGHLVGLIDFESCLSGDRLATLGYCAAIHWNQPFCAALRDAWPAALDADDQQRIVFYALLRALRLAQYAHRPLPTGYPRDPITHIFPGLVPALSTLTRI